MADAKLQLQAVTKKILVFYFSMKIPNDELQFNTIYCSIRLNFISVVCSDKCPRAYNRPPKRVIEPASQPSSKGNSSYAEVNDKIHLVFGNINLLTVGGHLILLFAQPGHTNIPPTSTTFRNHHGAAVGKQQRQTNQPQPTVLTPSYHSFHTQCCVNEVITSYMLNSRWVVQTHPSKRCH